MVPRNGHGERLLFEWNIAERRRDGDHGIRPAAFSGQAESLSTAAWRRSRDLPLARQGKKYLCPWPMPREWRCAVPRRWTAHKRCGPSAVPGGHKKRTDGPSESTFRIYCKVSHSCRQPALVKSRTACKQVSILLSSICRSSSWRKYQNCEPIKRRIASAFGAFP